MRSIRRPSRARVIAVRDVGIAAHVADLTELIWFEDLRDVHLVLHSYAGVLAGPVAEQAAGRLASVTFLAAFIARPGQCLLDVEPLTWRGVTATWPHRPGRAGLCPLRRSSSTSGA